jgi:hypothetical protein
MERFSEGVPRDPSSNIRPFSPLDPAERKPGEEILPGNRGGLQLQREPAGWRRMTRLELTAVVAVPALILLGIALGESQVSPPVAVVSISCLILALVARAFSGVAVRLIKQGVRRDAAPSGADTALTPKTAFRP